VSRTALVPASYVLLWREGDGGPEVLLHLRQNTGYMDGRWATLAGHVEEGESAVEAAVREAREEAGVGLAPGDLAVAVTMHRRTGEPGHERVDFFVVAERWRGEPTNREPGTCSELVWTPLDALPDDVIPYVRRALEDVRRGVHFDTWGWEPGTEPT
jgi:8-oxo-dGTP pyrophosphatase MutT (NUDIX family)